MASLTFACVREINADRCVTTFKQSLNDWSASDWFTALTGEVGEAANVVKKLNRIRDGAVGNSEVETEEYLRSELRDEIADVFLYLDLLAASEGIDLAEAVASKFNKTSEKLGAPHRLEANTRIPDPSVIGELVEALEGLLKERWDDLNSGMTREEFERQHASELAALAKVRGEM